MARLIFTIGNQQSSPITANPAIPMSPPKLTTEITSGTNTVRIYGKRSTKGWVVKEVGGATSRHISAAKEKDKAIRLALDCCDPDTHHTTYRVAPSG
jgi:hypothetical protein